MNDSFLSVVADKNNKANLMVRARKKQDLKNVVGDGVEILKTSDADYRWRAFINRQQFQKLVAERISQIDYTNFKNSVAEDDLHQMYLEFWSLHRRYQERDRDASK